MGRFKSAYLDVLNRTLNPLAVRLAKRGRGPFSLIRHIGRKSGRTFETPVILADSSNGLVAELTYGDQVNWYRNIVRGGGQIVHRGRTYRILSVEPLPAADGLAAYGPLRSTILRLLRRREFRLIRVAPSPSVPGGED
ncbi:nitroreductase family deazaflavin-dependent oxidoreductase [Microbacterium terregens]|uniref:Nitroreductase family deazaflavin-dependent oxidoreductase n=1 Tax=Microbacterium terregens TaxID=69363 RepID=A0ABV5T2C6_9MICO